MKTAYPLVLLVATGAMLVASTSLRASETDDRIESSAKKSYVFKTYLKDDSIKTESKNGAVTLTGTVAESSHKSLAEDTVEGLPGVKSVDNQLKIKGEGPAEHSDGWLSTKVKSALLFHRNVSATSTDVNVKDGIVILSGEASSLAQKELTTEYAKDVEGVKEVKNEMTIAKAPAKPVQTTGEKIDDASITAQVKSSLMSHRSTSALKTKVETTDGVVTLSGIAKNAAEKSLVTKLVNDINGVSSVVNNMTIAVAAASNKLKASRLLLAGGEAHQPAATEANIADGRKVKNMSLITIVITLIIVGVLLWLVNTYIPMDGKIKKILNIAVVVAVVLWLLNVFGVLGHLNNLRV